MGRTLGGDFEDDDLGGSLDLGSGSIASHHAASGASAYDGGGVDFDDPFAEEVASGPLELDLPSHSATALRSKAPTAPAPPLPPPASGPQIPDLNFPPPPASTPRVSGMISTQAAHSHAAAASQPSLSQAQLQQPSFGPPPASSSSPMMSGAPSSQRQAQMSGPPSSSPMMSGGPPASFAAHAPSSKPSAAAQIARYPQPPAQVWQAPLYALQVIRRQLELRTDLESLRRRRSPDVALYEAALRTYDAKTFRLGLSIDVALLAVFTIIFFMPVILRFTRSY